MKHQYVINSKGQRTGVIVSLKEWNALNLEIDKLKRELQELELTMRYKNAFEDADLFRQGSLKTYSIDSLLNDLK